MTRRTSHSSTEQEYLPGLGKHFLTPLYDLAHLVFGLRPVHQEMITLAGLEAGQQVLDVGCGTGNLLRATGRRHPDVHLAGLDPDLTALAIAERKLRRAGLGARLDRGFAQDLPCPDGSLDRVFSSMMLHHLDSTSKDTLLAEVRRVLRPDGLLVLADAIAEETGHGHRPGGGHRVGGMSSRMHDNVGDAVAARIASAGFTVEPTRILTLRVGGKVGIELARPTRPRADASGH
jgi:SAM-dependent methyltransferase